MKAFNLFKNVRRKYSTNITSESCLTKNRYPYIKRGNYNSLIDSHLKYFEQLLGKERVLTNELDVQPYNQDWLKMVCGYSKVVLKPKTTQEVSNIMKFCYNENLAVCPQGGNTGLVGGSVPVFDEIIISMSLMNKIVNIDPLSGTLTCQSGCILEQLDNELSNHNLMMPLDLGAKGSCQIGGNISTCAGGLRLLRYGSLPANTLGLEAVKANGEIIDCMNSLRKDNTGYHLSQLFIGSEGTLGIVTGAIIQCPPKPNAVNLAFLGLDTYNDVLKTFMLAKNMLSETLSSCEMMDSICMNVVTDKIGLKSPIGSFPFYMVIETHGSNISHDEEKMNIFLEKAMTDNLVKDGTLTNQPSQMNNLWQIRERITESLTKDNYVYKYDISLPLNYFYEIVSVIKNHLEGYGAKTVSGFGHIGDGNIHLNIQTDYFDRKLLERIEPFIFEWTQKVGGSISAEHGIGFKKAEFLKYAKTPQAISIMKEMKQMFDPKGILNPYKVLPH